MLLTRKNLTVLLIFFTFWNISHAQDHQQLDFVIENIIEHLTEKEEDTHDVNELFEKLVELTENPVNINSATENELHKLPFFNAFQIHSLREYINTYGEFLSIYELPMVFGFSEQFVKLIEPFIIVEPGNTGKDKKTTSRIRHEVILRSQRIIQEQIGYSEAKKGSKYIGNPYKIYSRYRVKQEGRFSAGITTEKDPGEHFFHDSLGNQIDYYSAHASFENLGFAERIIVGDYNASFGQGLVLWTGFASGKSSYTTEINRYATKLTPYTSTAENQFLRGGGATLKLSKNLKSSIFFSHKKIDGNLERSDNKLSDKSIFSSFQTSGYHNTVSLLNDKDAVTEKLFGINLESVIRSGRFGITAIAHKFDAYFLKDKNPYNTLHFSGEEYQAGSFYYRFNNKKIVLFGENAFNNVNDFALLNGIDYFIHPQLSLSILHRHFEPGYFSLYSDAFNESSKTQNENGTYLGIKFYPTTKLTLNSYFDMYKFPWLRYQVDAPSQGRDFFTEIIYSINTNSNLSVRFKNEHKNKNVSTDVVSRTSTLGEEILNKVRIHFDYKPIESIGLRSRLEFSNYSLASEKENGLLFYQDFHFHPVEVPFSAQLRFAFFNTDGYNSRIYAYENDLLYTFNIPAYFNKGKRFYINLRYKLSNKISFYLKFSQSHFNNSETIGSGLNEINGNKKSEIKAQVRLKF